MAEELTIDQIEDLEDDYVPSSQDGNEEDFTETETESENYYADNGYDYEDEQEDEDDGDDVLDIFLRTKGISDSSQIKFQDDDGNLYSKDWNDLSAEEQYNILNSTTEEDEDTALDENEIGLINELRRLNISPNEFINAVRQNGAAEYANQLQQYNENNPEYDLDELTDDEIFALDLQSRIENITDEELQDAIERARQNPDLYAKQVRGIREEYGRLVAENNQRAINEQQAQEAQLQQQFTDQIIDSVSSINEMGLPIELDYDDMEKLADYILEKDITGTTGFGRRFNDPQALVRMAFFDVFGPTIINDTVSYFQNEIAKVSQAQYDRGFKAGLNNNNRNTSRSRFAYRPAPQPDYTYVDSNNGDYSIDDLDS